MSWLYRLNIIRENCFADLLNCITINQAKMCIHKTLNSHEYSFTTIHKTHKLYINGFEMYVAFVHATSVETHPFNWIKDKHSPIHLLICLKSFLSTKHVVNLVKLLYWWSNVEKAWCKVKRSYSIISSYQTFISRNMNNIECIKIIHIFVGENATVFYPDFINLVFHSSKRDKSCSKTIKLTCFCVFFMLSNKIVHIKLYNLLRMKSVKKFPVVIKVAKVQSSRYERYVKILFISLHCLVLIFISLRII